MPTVDDLVISLRIDESSNLGKLQKQLKALVGDKGDKQVALGLDADTKRDLKIIKDRIIKFTPSVLMDSNLKEAARDLAVDLKKDTALKNKLIQKYSLNINKYETFLEELFSISLGISDMNADQQTLFIAEMDKFRKLANITKGELKTTVTKLTKMLLEKSFHKRLIAGFREAGVGILSKPLAFQLTKESMKGKMDKTIERFEDDEKLSERFAELVDIFETNTDSLEATSKAYFLQTGKNLDLTQLSQKQIYDDVKLHMIIAAQAKAALTKANWMQEIFYKAGKQLFTKTAFGVIGAAELDSVISKVSQKTLKDLGIEHVVGDQIEDGMNNILGEFKTVAGKDQIDSEVIKRLNTQNYRKLFFFAEEFSDEALERIKYYNQLEENKNKQIGAYKLTPRAMEKLLGIANKLDVMEQKAIKQLDKTEDVEDDITDEDKDFLKALEATEAEFRKEIEGVEKRTTGVVGEKGALDEDKIEDVLDLLDDIKATGDDTNKAVKEEDLNKANVEEDPTGDN